MPTVANLVVWRIRHYQSFKICREAKTHHPDPWLEPLIYHSQWNFVTNRTNTDWRLHSFTLVNESHGSHLISDLILDKSVHLHPFPAASYFTPQSSLFCGVRRKEKKTKQGFGCIGPRGGGGGGGGNETFSVIIVCVSANLSH